MSEQPLPSPKPDDQPIEAGEVGEIKELSFNEAQHWAETARSLATWLVVLLGAGLGVHYLLLLQKNGAAWRVSIGPPGCTQRVGQHRAEAVLRRVLGSVCGGRLGVVYPCAHAFWSRRNRASSARGY
jgi:hypothetical protein